MALEVNGKSYEVDEEGYLADLNTWDLDVAEAMALVDGAPLDENHWEVINFLREYYEEYQVAPAVRVLTKKIGKKLGKDKGNSKYLYELFPYEIRYTNKIQNNILDTYDSGYRSHT
jgi:tRNA 2-thiouridine synthesizing protein E